MPQTTDPLDALLAHNRWATRLILEKCRGLTEEHFGRPFPIGPAEHGGLRALLTHIVGAMRRWADRIAYPARPVRSPLESWRAGHVPAPPLTVDDLVKLLEDAHRDLTGVINEIRSRGEAGMEREIVFRFTTAEGRPIEHRFTTGAAIASAAVHGHYHRAQCMNVLRQLGVPTASVDVIDWQEAEEGGGGGK